MSVDDDQPERRIVVGSPIDYVLWMLTSKPEYVGTLRRCQREDCCRFFLDCEVRIGNRRDAAKMFALLPRAAEEYRKQIVAGLNGDPTEAAAARLTLRDLIGPVTLTPGKPGELWGSYTPSFSALLKTAGTDYRGEAI